MGKGGSRRTHAGGTPWALKSCDAVSTRCALPWLLSQASAEAGGRGASNGPSSGTSNGGGTREDDSAYAASSLEDEGEGHRMIALVELARNGDTEAFGQLYDHYNASVYRFLYYRVGSVPLAEDLTSETEDMSALDTTTEGPEGAVLASLTNEALLEALSELPDEQRECLVMRFLQGLSIAETAEALERSAGAVKQLQLRGVRNLARILPDGMRG